MITKFDTTPASSSKGGNTLLIVGIIAVVGFLAYRFVIKPRMDKAKEEKK
jgi:hypothetical protein